MWLLKKRNRHWNRTVLQNQRKCRNQCRFKINEDWNKDHREINLKTHNKTDNVSDQWENVIILKKAMKNKAAAVEYWYIVLKSWYIVWYIIPWWRLWWRIGRLWESQRNRHRHLRRREEAVELRVSVDVYP